MDAEIPESRTYTHTSCGNTTSVSGHDFTDLADPFIIRRYYGVKDVRLLE